VVGVRYVFGAVEVWCGWNWIFGPKRNGGSGVGGMQKFFLKSGVLWGDVVFVCQMSGDIALNPGIRA
jgi:hypothetical protein